MDDGEGGELGEEVGEEFARLEEEENDDSEEGETTRGGSRDGAGDDVPDAVDEGGEGPGVVAEGADGGAPAPQMGSGEEGVVGDVFVEEDRVWGHCGGDGGDDSAVAGGVDGVDDDGDDGVEGVDGGLGVVCGFFLG